MHPFQVTHPVATCSFQNGLSLGRRICAHFLFLPQLMATCLLLLPLYSAAIPKDTQTLLTVKSNGFLVLFLILSQQIKAFLPWTFLISCFLSLSF
jgi:hypothetical protein